MTPSQSRPDRLGLSDLVGRWAELQPEASYLEEANGPGRVSFAELAAACRQLEEKLDLLGVPPGAGVMVRGRNILDYASTLVAVVAAGRVAVPVDPSAPTAELLAVRAAAQPAAAAGDRQLRALAGRRLCPGNETATGGIFLSTSGTSGLAKGVLLSERQLWHVATAIASHHELSPGERGLNLLPLFHVNAEVVGLLANLHAGATLLLTDHFHRTGFWELVEQRDVSWVNAAPAIIAILARTDGPPRPLPGVRFVRSASAPLPATTLRAFEELTGLRVLESYGMTEAASMITANPLAGGKAGSVGLPVAGQLRVVDDSGEPTAAGAVGRVEVSGPGVISSYAVGGEGAFMPDGWLDTKDLGYLDEDGFLFLVGRADDVINRGGEKLYPREVEEVLLAHHSVEAAVVVGLPDRVLGAQPVAVVVATPPAGQDGPERLAVELRSMCAERLSAYKVPREIRIVEQLPVGATGKVVRRRVAQLAATGR